jgi:rubredoxin
MVCFVDESKVSDGVKEQHNCPLCGLEQMYYQSTWLCPKCNAAEIWDLWWMKEFQKGNIYNFDYV